MAIFRIGWIDPHRKHEVPVRWSPISGDKVRIYLKRHCGSQEEAEEVYMQMTWMKEPWKTDLFWIKDIDGAPALELQ